jgi:hypothetical protein
MKRRRGRSAVLVWAVVAGLVLAIWPAGAQAQGGGWQWQNPLPGGNYLAAVWGTSGSEVFAVGRNGTILHYDGAEWGAMSSGTPRDLLGVWGSTGSDVFAVGAVGTIRHYDGAAWSWMQSGTNHVLEGVWGGSGGDVFAVGDDAMLHYDGAAWSAMDAGGRGPRL